MTKVRKMWAKPAELQHNDGYMWLSGDGQQTQAETVPVLVTDATGMPEFRPGDRVRSRGATTGMVATHPQRIGDGSWVVVVEWPNNVLCVMAADPERLTKLPRETSVLLRVTGPENLMSNVIRNGETMMGQWRDQGVRVERVEDPDAKAER